MPEHAVALEPSTHSPRTRCTSTVAAFGAVTSRYSVSAALRTVAAAGRSCSSNWTSERSTQEPAPASSFGLEPEFVQDTAPELDFSRYVALPSPDAGCSTFLPRPAAGSCSRCSSDGLALATTL